MPLNKETEPNQKIIILEKKNIFPVQISSNLLSSLLRCGTRPYE